MAVDLPSTLYKEHIPLLISTIPTNKRQTPNIIFSPLLSFDSIFDKLILEVILQDKFFIQRRNKKFRCKIIQEINLLLH